MKQRFKNGPKLLLLTLLVSINFQGKLHSQTNSSGSVGAIDAAVAARATFLKARAKFQIVTNDAVVAWQFGRACFDEAEFATSKDERAEIAELGIAACRKSLALTNSAPGHYYLGMNLGQLAQTELLGALKLVGEMEQEFSTARNLDEYFDYAGPDRNLGLLYRDAPSFGSIGSRSKARLHLRRAVELAPDHPENRLNLIETYLKWNDRNAALRELKALEQVLPESRKKFSAPEWTSTWNDWNQRLAAAKRKLEQAQKVLESPRQSQ